MLLVNLQISLQICHSWNIWDLFHEVNNYVLHEKISMIYNKVLQVNSFWISIVFYDLYFFGHKPLFLTIILYQLIGFVLQKVRNLAKLFVYKGLCVVLAVIVIVGVWQEWNRTAVTIIKLIFILISFCLKLLVY